MNLARLDQFIGRVCPARLSGELQSSFDLLESIMLWPSQRLTDRKHLLKNWCDGGLLVYLPVKYEFYQSNRDDGILRSSVNIFIQFDQVEGIQRGGIVTVYVQPVIAITGNEVIDYVV